MLCAGGGSRKIDGVTPSLTLNMHLNPPASHGPPSSAASSRPTTRPSSGRSASSCSSTAHAAAAGGGSAATAVANVQLRPSTVWLSLPLLQRLQSFFEPLSNLPAAVTQDDRCAMLCFLFSTCPVCIACSAWNSTYTWVLCERSVLLPSFTLL